MKVQSIIAALAFTVSAFITADALAYEKCKEEACSLEVMEETLWTLKGVQSEKPELVSDEFCTQALAIHDYRKGQYDECVSKANEIALAWID